MSRDNDSLGGAASWHLKPQARALIARCQPGEFHVVEETRSYCDAFVFRGLTDRARQKLERLEALRRDAIFDALGYGFDSQPYDDERRRTYVLTDFATPEIHVVLRDAFERRAQTNTQRAA